LAFVATVTAIGCAGEIEDPATAALTEIGVHTSDISLHESAFLRCLAVTSYYYPYYGEAIVPSYYLQRYPDLVAAFGWDERRACQHYVEFGIAEGRQASPVFDVHYYLANNPDVLAAFGYSTHSALQHWEAFGIHEGRRGSAQFDPAWYLAANPDVAAAFGSTWGAIYHWIDHGQAEGRPGAP
jgi:hypothetical protein